MMTFCDAMMVNGTVAQHGEHSELEHGRSQLSAHATKEGFSGAIASR
jgi:hypothetical protein